MERRITGTIRKDTPEPPKRYVGWRGLYRVEGGNDHAWLQPAVIPSQWNGQKYGTRIQFTRELQFLSWEFTQFKNKLMDSMNWARTFNGDVMLTNGNGWDNQKKPEDQRRDYVNNRYYGYPDPYLMDAIYSAGNFMPYLEERDGHLWAIPGLSGVNVNGVLPSVEQIWERNWYMRLTVNQKSETTGNPSDFPNGKGLGVFVPYFLRESVPFTTTHFERWDSDVLPDPLEIP